MGIDKISLQMAGPSHRLIPRVGTGLPSTPNEVLRKSFGEPLPKMADISRDPFLQALFSQQGVAERVRRKLAVLSRKNGRLVPARGIVASAINASPETSYEDLVFVGVDFLAECHPQEETVAGVLAHEWGHLVSEFPNGMNPDLMSWDEIFALRKEEEAAADGFAGKMLFRMGLSPDGLIRFLSRWKEQKEGLKYPSLATRAAIIRRGFDEAKRRRDQAKNLILVPQAAYGNPWTSRLIAVA